MRTAVLGACLAAAVVVLSLPVRRDVAGLSMAPDLMPGDRVVGDLFPLRDRRRPCSPHERWIVSAPDGTEAIKRIAACGGTLRMVDGDLEIDGKVAPPPPGILAERAAVVREIAAGREIVADGEEILDDAPFAPGERRLLLPVGDIGVCIVVRAVAGGGSRFEIGVGGRSVAWKPSGPGRFAFLAGRVDRHLVAVAWRLSGGATKLLDHRSRLPRGLPETWAVARRWSDLEPGLSPRLSLRVDALDPPGEGAVVERVLLWRDVLYRPAADGRTAWMLAAGDVFILGDFPSASIDSRHFGPLPRGAVLHRVNAVFRATVSARDRGEHSVGLVEHGDGS